jgi:hypothetical protein
LEKEFNLRTVKMVVFVNGIERCVGIPFDEHGVSLNSFANTGPLKITGEPNHVPPSLAAQITSKLTGFENI